MCSRCKTSVTIKITVKVTFCPNLITKTSFAIPALYSQFFSYISTKGFVHPIEERSFNPENRRLALPSHLEIINFIKFVYIITVLPYHVLPYSLASTLPCLVSLLASSCPLAFCPCHLPLIFIKLLSTH